MPAILHTLAQPSERPPALRVSLVPGGGADAGALVRAYLPLPTVVATRCPDPDLAVVWWDGPGTPVERPSQPSVPLVALCAGGPDVLSAALDAGADYALALPVSAALLRSVCRAHARYASPTPTASRPARAAAGVLHLDRRARTLTVRGRPVHLTLREFSLLSDLIGHAGTACSRDDLLERVWGIEFETGTNTVDVFIYALRQKLRAAGLRGAIQTVRGVGYRLDASLL